jgi:hypothetical protein
VALQVVFEVEASRVAGQVTWPVLGSVTTMPSRVTLPTLVTVNV